LPYVREWHRRYEGDGLRVIGVHTSGFPPSASEAAVRAAVARLEIDWPVAIDLEYGVWQWYGNEGWPARYLWNQRGALFEYHYGEGAYDETERAIQELLGVERELVAPVRPEDAPGAALAPQTQEPGGRVLGALRRGRRVGRARRLVARSSPTAARSRVPGPGAYPLIEHDRHTEGELELTIGEGVTCLATCFTPGRRGGALERRASRGWAGAVSRKVPTLGTHTVL